MTARLRKTGASRTAGSGQAIAAPALVAAAVACTSYTEIPIETPIQPKLDVSPFQRIFIAGFIAGANEDVDANMETVRLLRSQLRNKGIMRVIDADTLPLLEVAKQNGGDDTAPPVPDQQAVARRPAGSEQAAGLQRREGSRAVPAHLRERRVLEADRRGVSAAVDRDRRGAVRAAATLGLRAARAGSRTTRSAAASRGAGPHLHGAQGLRAAPDLHLHRRPDRRNLHSETFREEILYNANQQTPALSSYFELMDRLLPAFLNTLSAQKIKGTRTLLK